MASGIVLWNAAGPSLKFRHQLLRILVLFHDIATAAPQAQLWTLARSCDLVCTWNAAMQAPRLVLDFSRSQATAWASGAGGGCGDDWDSLQGETLGMLRDKSLASFTPFLEEFLK